MGRKWIIDVLADLRSFAEANDLPLLAEELGRTSRLAQAELASMEAGPRRAAEGHGTRYLSHRAGAGGGA